MTVKLYFIPETVWDQVQVINASLGEDVSPSAANVWYPVAGVLGDATLLTVAPTYVVTLPQITDGETVDVPGSGADVEPVLGGEDGIPTGSYTWSATVNGTPTAMPFTAVAGTDIILTYADTAHPLGAFSASSQTITVEGLVTAPDPFTSLQWNVAAGAAIGALNIIISELPFDGNSAITDLQRQIDGGSWVSLGGTTTGTYTLTGQTAGLRTVSIRAVNAVNPADAASTKQVNLPDYTEVFNNLVINDNDDAFEFNVVQACTVKYVTLPTGSTPTSANRADLYAGTYSGTITTGTVGTFSAGSGPINTTINDTGLSTSTAYRIVIVTNVANSAIQQGTFTTNAGAPTAIAAPTLISQNVVVGANGKFSITIDDSAATAGQTVTIAYVFAYSSATPVIDQWVLSSGETLSVAANSGDTPGKTGGAILMYNVGTPGAGKVLDLSRLSGTPGPNGNDCMFAIHRWNKALTLRSGNGHRISSAASATATITSVDNSYSLCAAGEERPSSNNWTHTYRGGALTAQTALLESGEHSFRAGYMQITTGQAGDNYVYTHTDGNSHGTAVAANFT